ncbi:MAG: hypothetical protein HZA46_17090 [Planctomycetales bacterium]|nr:hypothetical protein [Planctomycetales bacterium]
MSGDAAHAVIETNQQREVSAPIRIGDGGWHAVAIFLEDFQRRVDGVVGEVQEPRLLGVPVHEGECLVGEQVRGVAVELLPFASPINHVARIGGLELRLGVFAEREVVHGHEESKEVIESSSLRQMRGTESEMPLPDQARGVTGRVELIGDGPLVERQTERVFITDARVVLKTKARLIASGDEPGSRRSTNWRGDIAARAAHAGGKPITEEELTKDNYTGKDFDDELFIDMRTPAMCADLFKLLCENGGPEQKVIIFCNREIHADRVAMQMNNLYVRWCRDNQREPKDHYAFKCMGGPNNGADMIEPMRGSGERAFIACTVDLLEAGVDIERLNAVVFFRYLNSAIKFYQMFGRGTRIHEETKKYKFWLYDYTGVTDLFGTDFITNPPRPRGGGGGGGGGDDGGDGGDGGGGGGESPPVPEIPGHTGIIGLGRFIPGRRDGRDVMIPVEEYRREMIRRVLSEAHNLDEFRELWIEKQKRDKLIVHLRGDNFSPELLRDVEQMTDYDFYDLFAHHGYRARALKRPERKTVYLENNQPWFESMDVKAATVLRALGHQFEVGGTEALEKTALWDVPEISDAGGFDALRTLGTPVAVMKDAKTRLFAA